MFREKPIGKTMILAKNQTQSVSKTGIAEEIVKAPEDIIKIAVEKTTLGKQARLDRGVGSTRAIVAAKNRNMRAGQEKTGMTRANLETTPAKVADKGEKVPSARADKRRTRLRKTTAVAVAVVKGNCFGMKITVTCYLILNAILSMKRHGHKAYDN